MAVLTPTSAATGAAPPSQQRRVVSGVHADAIAVFADSGGLTLGSKADIDANLGVRLDPNLTLFNVEDAARIAVPNLPGFAFLVSAGSDVWIAPEVQKIGLLWPGFSSEGVPVGVLDDDQLTLRLEAVSGPGTLHVFQSGAFGEPNRLFSSTDTVHRAWTIPRGTHAHANWAFSAPGAYTLTFTVNALRGGSPVTDTQDYRFHVGEPPPAVTTTTTLAASTNATILGTAVDLTATVTPAGAVGYVEFMDGSTVLGHEAVNAGSAGLTTTNLLLGARSVTARFVPQWLNDFSASASAPVIITVTEPGGVPFGLSGIATSYLPGDSLTARVVGHTLQPGQKYRWQWRVNGSAEFELGDLSTSPVFTRDLSASDNGYELSVSVWFCEEWDEFCTFGTAIAQSPWVPVSVLNLGDPIVATLLSATHAHMGDEALIAVSGRTLAEGEILQVVRRDLATGWHTWSSDELFAHQANTVRIYLLAGGEFAVRVLNAEGVAVAQSAPMPIQVEEYEVQIAGVNGLYRPGATLQAQGIIHPESTKLFYQWSMFVPGGLDLGIIKEGYGPGATTLEIPDLTLAHNAGVLFLSVSVPIGPPFVEEEGLAQAGQINVRVYVQDIDPGKQIFQFQPLPDHYHQGNAINLVLGVDPLPALGDQIVWEWRWPGGDWATFSGAAGTTHTLIAEQALDGVQVRSSLVFADANQATIGAGPVTIFVDDHGAAARQQPTVVGVTTYTAGQQATLTRQLPANGATILTTHRWERKAAGASEFTVIPEATGATLNFTTTTADRGAQYRVSILKPNGALAYGPSPSVTLDVMAAPGVYTGGHADIGVSYVDNQLVFRYALGASAIVDGSPLGAPAHAAPGEIITQAGTAAYQQITGPIAAYFPGKTHGYFFGAQSSETSPYLGLGADDPSLSAQSWVTAPGDEPFPRMRYRITGVNYTGPAANPQVLYYDVGTTGDLFVNYNNLDPASATPLPLPIVTFIHAHPNWGFSDPGIYDITLTASAEHTTDGPMTATGVFRFEILPVPVPLRPIVLDQGHIDLFELTWNTNRGQLDLMVKDDTGLYAPDTAYRQPENVTILVDTELSELMFGDDDLPPGYEFIPRNQPIYLLESSQQDGLPWPGWSTERLLDSLPEGVTIPFDTGSVEFAVTVEGPGDVVTFIDGGFGTPSNRFIDTTDEAPDVILTDSSTHYHTTWLFTKPGDYLLTVTPRAYPSFPSKAEPLTGPAHVYHMRVGPRPEFETVPEGFEMSIVGAPFSVTNDTPVNLQLVLSGPQPAIGGYQWYHFMGEEGQQPIVGATGPAVSLTVDPWDSAQVVLFDPTGRVLTQAGVQFLPPPGPPDATIHVNGYSDAPATAAVSWATVYDGRSPLTKQVVTLIPQDGNPIVQEVTGSVNDAAFTRVPAGTYTATVQAFNALGAGAVSEPSAPFTVEPLSLSITQTDAAPGAVTLAIATQIGVVYQVESAPTLTGPWTNVGDPINGTGQTVPLVVPASSSAGFYRWRLVEAP